MKFEYRLCCRQHEMTPEIVTPVDRNARSVDFQNITRKGGRTPRERGENFGAGQDSLRSAGPGGAGCHLPRPSVKVSVRLLSGSAGTDQTILKPVPNVPVVQSLPFDLASLRSGQALRSSRYRLTGSKFKVPCLSAVQRSREDNFGGELAGFDTEAGASRAS